MISISGHGKNYWKEQGFADYNSYLSVNCCGYQKFVTRNFSIRRDNGRVDYQIIYIVNGKGYYKLGTETVTVPEGNVVIYTPGQPQNYSYCFEDSTELYWLHFTGCGARERLARTGLLEKNVYYIGLDNKCIELFKSIIYELQVKKTFWNDYAAAHLLELFSYIGRKLLELKNPNNCNRNGDLKDVIHIMHTEYSRNHTVEYFASKSNLSMYRFIHKFKEYTGMTPIEYITSIRVEAAKELLANSSLNISEVANIVGYDNPLYFSRVFKKNTGMSPSRYKEKTIK